MDIGENIRYLRKLRSLTQYDIAKVVGVTCQAVSKWERGETRPDIDTLPVLSECLNVTIDELFYGIKS